MIENQKKTNTLEEENKKLLEELNSKHKLIEKLNNLYEEIDDKCFETTKEYEKKGIEY